MSGMEKLKGQRIMFKLMRIAKLFTFLKPHEFIMASQSPTELSFSHMAELRLSPINMW